MTNPAGQAPPQRQLAAWPLMLLAGCSFIPVFGLIFSAIAVPWGLVSTRRRARLGALISLAGAVLNIAGISVATLVFERTDAFTQAEVEQTRRNLDQLVGVLEDYHARNGQYPASLQALVSVSVPGVGAFPTRIVGIYDHTRPFSIIPRLYRYSVSPDGKTYDLFSVGADGVPGTSDDIRPQIPDSIRSHSGYRPAAP
jgi:general secretion pathway protein G